MRRVCTERPTCFIQDLDDLGHDWLVERLAPVNQVSYVQPLVDLAEF